MYISDGICYAGQLVNEIRITDYKILRGHMLLITFSTGEQRLFDVTQLKEPVFTPLADDTVFNDITLFHGVLTWNNGEIDIAPETVYAESFPYSAPVYA